LLGTYVLYSGIAVITVCYM